MSPDRVENLEFCVLWNSGRLRWHCIWNSYEMRTEF